MTRCQKHMTDGLNGESCEDCEKAFEFSSSYCPHCWKVVSNSVYFGKRGKSIHLDGRCSEKQTSIPASFFARKCTAARSVDPISGYWRSSEEAMDCNKAIFARKVSKAVYLHKEDEPSLVVVPIQSESIPIIDPLAERLAKLLEEQNDLLKKLAA